MWLETRDRDTIGLNPSLPEGREATLSHRDVLPHRDVLSHSVLLSQRSSPESLEETLAPSITQRKATIPRAFCAAWAPARGRPSVQGPNSTEGPQAMPSPHHITFPTAVMER
ncbi:hypothetical protein O6H91_16G040300 [Diphasiastrum complanatum]|uniref:Uncharacterized protein n=1 Tax=Diphasiastrum complanatum TaxID=34168 RepID=A0ACC2BBR6_DIPCM|nr:hypothetical protein O6H91_16G040300 [Diphasiastrum complanatum]